jgi:hypothetical protein
MSPDEFQTILEHLRDPRFDEAILSIREAMRTGDARISASHRSIPGRELIEIYERRREHCRAIDLHIAGLDSLVDVLTAEPNANWTIVSFSGGGRWGLVFLKQATEPRACLAGTEDRAIGGFDTA